jgi:hypothetical protein
VIPVDRWPPSTNSYDWLGEGIYFWEHSPARAMQWAEQQISRVKKKHLAGTEPAIVGAVIQLNPCFDLTDIASTQMLASGYGLVRELYTREEKELPQNFVGVDRLRRDLDCLVINTLLAGDKRFKTVRGVFLEGKDAYPGAMIKEQTHIQIAVRDASCILGVFRPNFNE